MKIMYTISMILPYFTRETGKWPNYIDWHLASCEANPSVDFYIFTDSYYIDKWDKVKNIHITHMTFEQCVSLFKEKLGADIVLDRPYKLTDYKPTYGVVFSEWIKDADFWGFYDCDTLLGNLRNYYTDELLGKYDKLMVLGQFQLFRNRYDVNHYYCLDRSPQSHYYLYRWENVCHNSTHYGYDEGRGVPILLREHGIDQFWDMKSFANIHQPSYYKHVFDKNVACNRPFQVWHWSSSQGLHHIDMLTKKKTEKTFIHFTEREMNCEMYDGQKEIYVTQKSEFKTTIRFRDSLTGGEYIVLMMKKIFVWIGWHITHLKGKKEWEM